MEMDVKLDVVKRCEVCRLKDGRYAVVFLRGDGRELHSVHDDRHDDRHDDCDGFDYGDMGHAVLAALVHAPDLDPPKEQPPKPAPAKKQVSEKEARERILDCLGGLDGGGDGLGCKAIARHVGLRANRCVRLLNELLQEDSVEHNLVTDLWWAKQLEPEPVAAKVLERIKT
jgi:hypothetical protein